MSDDLHDRLDLVEREMARRKAQRFYTLYPETGPLRRSEYPKHMEAMAAGKEWMERLVMAGNRVGKTIGIGAYETACHLTGLYPSWWTGLRFKKPPSAWAVGTTSETTMKIVQAALIGTPEDPHGMVPENLVMRRTPKRSGETGSVATVTVRHSSGGTSVCEFKSYEMGRKGFEGREKDWIWCLAAGELVQMADGRLKPIEQVIPGDSVLSLNGNGQTVVRRVTHAVDRGLRPCVRVNPKNGTPVVCTPDHDIYWGYNLKSKQAAAETSRVAQPQPGWWPKVTEDRSDAWYVWAALIVAEGTVKSRKITSGDEAAIGRAIALLDPKEARVRKKTYSATSRHVPDWHLYWPTMWTWFEGQLSATKGIPEWIFTSSPEKAALFVRWLYQGDGWAYGHTIGYATTSYRLAQELVVLLNRLGIRAAVNRRASVGAWKEQWWVLVSRSTEVVKFLDRIGIEGKDAAVAKVLAEAERRCISKVLRSQHLVTSGLGLFTERNRRNQQKSAKVRSVEQVGERHVYDITVENEHRFLAGTSLVSNCDEEPPMDIYQECLFRLLTTKGRLLVTFTPLQGRSDVVKAFLELEDKDAAQSKIVIQAGWKDVPHLDEDTKRKILASTLPYQREARMNGEPVLGVGVIYPIAESDITIANYAIPDTWPKSYGLDVGWNRTAAVFVAREMGTGKYLLYDIHYMGSTEPPSQAMGIKARGDWLVGAIDPASRGRSQVDGRRLITEYKKLGLDLVEADNAVEAGILAVWTMLVSGQLQVMEKCLPWFKEFRNYHRDEQGVIVKKDDHALDATRYWARTGINHMKPKPMRRREGQGIDIAGGERSWMGN